MGPGVLWVAALLASMLGFPRLLGADYADGTLEQIALAPQPPGRAGRRQDRRALADFGPAAGARRAAARFAIRSRGDALAMLIVSLLIGTPVLSLLGAIGAALTLGLRAASALVPLLVLPLTVPVLIFGAGAVDAAASGLSAAPHLSLLASVLVLAMFFAPWAAAAAVRIALE
jgi:heme exporter protein B